MGKLGKLELGFQCRAKHDYFFFNLLIYLKVRVAEKGGETWPLVHPPDGCNVLGPSSVAFPAASRELAWEESSQDLIWYLHGWRLFLLYNIGP